MSLEPQGLTLRARRLLVAALLLAQLALLSLWIRPAVSRGGNESARLATVESLVERGSFAIDGATIDTVDRVKIGGRFYSNKPLLLSLWLAALYAPLHAAGLSFADHLPLLVRVLTLLGTASFSLLLLGLFAERLRSRRVGWGRAYALASALLWTTWIWSYSVSLNNHTPAAALLFGLLWLLERQEAEPRRQRAFGAGLLVAALLAVEIPTGGAFFLVGLVLVWAGHPAARKAQVLAYLGGFALLTAGMALLNLGVYGYPLDAYLVPGSFAFAESIHAPAAGGLRPPVSLGGYFFHWTFGWRGLFSHLPALLLGFVFLWRQRRRLSLLDRASLGGLVLLFAFYATRTGDFGGWSYGFRFLVSVIPILFWWLALAWVEASRRWRLGLAAPFLLVGALTSWVGAQNPWLVCFEGVSTKPGVVEWEVRSPFLSGLLVWSYERAPDGRLFGWLSREIYGLPTAARYLRKELSNRRREDLLPALDRRVEGWRRELRGGEPLQE